MLKNIVMRVNEEEKNLILRNRTKGLPQANKEQVVSKELRTRKPVQEDSDKSYARLVSSMFEMHLGVHNEELWYCRGCQACVKICDMEEHYNKHKNEK